MKAEGKTIEDFVERKMATPRIQGIIGSWRVEPEVIRGMIIAHFRDMGIFFVERAEEDLMVKNLIHQLKYSPEIMGEVHKANQDELRKKRSRHAE